MPVAKGLRWRKERGGRTRKFIARGQGFGFCAREQDFEKKKKKLILGLMLHRGRVLATEMRVFGVLERASNDTIIASMYGQVSIVRATVFWFFHDL